MTDRRAVFFLVFAVSCFALIPVALPEHRGVAATVGAVYCFYALLSWLDALSKRRLTTRTSRTTPGRGRSGSTP